jgi:hypothetical protein
MDDEKNEKKEVVLGVDLPDELPPSKRKSALVDIVESIIRSDYEKSELKKYLRAIENKDAVTGSVEWDRAKAAEIVTEAATEKGLAEYFDGVLLVKVRAAVNRAMNRMDLGTQQRLERKKLIEAQDPGAQTTETT